MKKILSLLIAILLIFSFASCGGGDDSKIIKELTSILGELKDLSMNVDEVVESLDKEAEVFLPTENESTEELSVDKLVIAENAVVYKTSRAVTQKTEDAKEISYVINAMHFGKLVPETKTGNVAFVSANIEIVITSADKDYARSYLLSLISDAPISLNAKKLYTDAIGGKIINVSKDSILWDEFVDLDDRMKIVCDKENGTFEVRFIGEPGRLYHDTVRDENDMVLKDIAYYFDEDGNKYIEEIEENIYKDDQMYSKRTLYYYMTDIVKEIAESYRKYEGDENGGTVKIVPVMEIKYYENGNLESEYYNLGDEKYVKREYYENGQVQNEEYWKDDGTKVSGSYEEDGTVFSYEEYYQNGNTKYSHCFVESEFMGQQIMTFVEYYYYESGILQKEIRDNPVFKTKEVREYREDETIKYYAIIGQDGEITEETFFDENGNEI
ncbi:MAG: hypothetical protein IJD95_05740 [Clostridia bacterium]|nr:hypothetical protein [Clostridia bacterium]